jgi:ABC-type polysaccharide/polyol phosphate export permease
MLGEGSGPEDRVATPPVRRESTASPSAEREPSSSGWQGDQGFLLRNLVAKEFKVMYRNMALGMAWSLMRPLVLLAVLSVVWILFFDAPRQFPAAVFVVLVPFNMFSQCITDGAHAIVGNRQLVRKVAFPRHLLPVSVLVCHLIHFSIQIPLVVAALWLLGRPGGAPDATLLWLIPLALGFVVMTAGATLLVASLNVVYRDVQYIVESALVVLFWLSPILYEPRDVLLDGPAVLFWLYYANPLAGFLEAIRDVAFHGRTPAFAGLGVSILVGAAITTWGVASFRRHQRQFADLL